MAKCKDCPLLGEDTPCLSSDRRWSFFCEWAASGDPIRRSHVVSRSRVGATPEKATPAPGPALQTPGVPFMPPSAPLTPDGGDIIMKDVLPPDWRHQEDEMPRNQTEINLQRAVMLVNACRYRGPEAQCKCNGKRKCAKGFGFRGEVTLNNCIDCVMAGKNR